MPHCAKILRETWGNNILTPLYDNEESVCGIVYNDVPYYFQKNLQGDVIAIVDKNAETIARYTYDAWGKVTVLDAQGVDISDNKIHIANINPFRYRGYYFDNGTNLYYLQSRYYDAEVGRFVNGDMAEFAAIQQGFVEHNLFAYCGNSSIILVDEFGCKSDSYKEIKYTVKNRKMSITIHYKLYSKKICKSFSEKIIEDHNAELSKDTMASEIFAHAILFLLGLLLGIVVIFSLWYFAGLALSLYKIIGIVAAVAIGTLSGYLLYKSYKIDVALDSKDSRQKYYDIIWNIF